MTRFFLLSLFLVFSFTSNTAKADCVNPAGIEGDQVYNSTHKTMQFCDGTNWYSMKGGNISGDNLGDHTGTQDLDMGSNKIINVTDPTNAQDAATKAYVDVKSGGVNIPNCKSDMSNIEIGDICDDGSIFLGSHPYYSWQGFYLSDQLVTGNWATTVTACNNLNRHSHTDWYLPTRKELNYMSGNHDKISSLNGISWSSSSINASNAYLVYLTAGNANSTPKNSSTGSHCVRRE